MSTNQSVVRRCMAPGCGNTKAKFRPVLVLHPLLWIADKTPHKIALNATVCKACSKILKPSELINDQWWERIVEDAYERSEAPPVRENTTLEFERI
ncbi:MAG: hypothetical protein KAT46_03850 [Deltaproteobacteria bacterium]|nr:hypothetical protein [Deltaproteobacteria bacterium]